MTQLRENLFKKRLLRTMGKRWDVQSHEDMLSQGIPDLSFGMDGVNGWIELKDVPDWNRVGIAKPSKFTANQVNWLKRRGKAAGSCFIMVQVKKSAYLLNHTKASRVKRGMTREEYENNSLTFWDRAVNAEELRYFLMGYGQYMGGKNGV